MTHTEHRQHRRRGAAGLGLIGGAAAVAALAMVATSPTARADNVAAVPVLPVVEGDQNPVADFGLPGLFSYSEYEQHAFYADLLGYFHDTATGDGNFPTWHSLTVGNFTNTLFIDNNNYDLVLGAIPIDPQSLPFEGGLGTSTFDHFSTGFLGIDNYFALTPVTVDGTVTHNINDTLVFNPTGLGEDGSGIDCGIQYLYLPDADVAVNELNILGQGGDILFSIPLGGDWLDLF